MSRNLIDMDTLTEMIKRICCHAEDETDLLDALKEMPTIDAVEVVRCRDCKYWYPNGIGICKLHDIRPTPIIMDDWFCADGERRDPCSSQDS